MKQLYRSAVRINKHKPQEYWHQRFITKVVDETRITYLKSKLMVEQSVDNIKDLLTFNNNNASKKERYFNNDY